MAMCDYGAVVKKNGKIITDPNGSLFQNYSTLKFNQSGKWVDVDKIDPLTGETYTVTIFEGDENYIDETIVKRERWEFEDYPHTKNNGNLMFTEDTSFAGNYMAVIGDEHFLIGFYKQGFSIAIDGHMPYFQEDFGIEPSSFYWFNGDFMIKHSGHTKGIEYNVHDLKGNYITTIKVDKIDKDEYGYGILIAKFTYKGDKYEVVYGYAVDPNPSYLFGKKSFLSPHRVTDYKYSNGVFKEIYGNRIQNNYKERKKLRFLKDWYNGVR